MQACVTLSHKHSVDRASDSLPITGHACPIQGRAWRARFAPVTGRNRCHQTPAHPCADREARASRARRAKAAESGPPLSTFIASWQLALEAAAKSSGTARIDTMHPILRPDKGKRRPHRNFCEEPMDFPDRSHWVHEKLIRPIAGNSFPSAFHFSEGAYIDSAYCRWLTLCLTSWPGGESMWPGAHFLSSKQRGSPCWHRTSDSRSNPCVRR